MISVLVSVGSTDATIFPYADLTRTRCFKEQTLLFLNETTFYFLLQMENIFRDYYTQVCSKQEINLTNFFINLCNTIDFTIPNCHALKEKIIKSFVTSRLKKNVYHIAWS